ncbi:MAG: DUF4214 domain-containing protein [Oscillospiraceae bacterium]|jgi:hypothetical protein|nr:DUF4214 domain-containing protein [Oscillospiraceae bacterium]
MKRLISTILFLSIVFSFAIGSFEVLATSEENDGIAEVEKNTDSFATNNINTLATNDEPDGISVFVERLYLTVLGRDPEASGFQEWTNRLRNGTVDGASTAHGFFFSTEFTSKNLSDEVFVETLYKALMGREPDSIGRTHWLNCLNSGLPREDVFSGFVNSPEFTRICESLGIIRGNHSPPPGGWARVLVISKYRNIFNRTPDTSGLNHWHTLLTNGNATGAGIAHAFIFSVEYQRLNTSNEAFVDMLYRSLLRRAPDNQRANWINLLNNNLPREDVFASFVNSAEYIRISAEHGVVHGGYTPPAAGMARVFVTRLYRTTLNRAADENGLNSWHSRLRDGTSTGSSIAYNFIFSPEMHNRNLTDSQFVDILYNALLGRAPDAYGRDAWISRLQGSMSRYDVFVGFVTSPEYARLCTEYGIPLGTAPQAANLMAGETMIARVWNHIVRANFIGISDRPEHIAGIIGNLQAEAGNTLCPFQQEVVAKVGIGLMQWSWGRRTSVENYMWANGISQEAFEAEMNKHLNGICTNPRHVHPIDFLDHVIQVQIDFMFHELRNTSERSYMNYINHPTNQTGIAGARAYAELFCAISLRPSSGVGEINDIQDEGVIEARLSSPYNIGSNLGRISFSRLSVRRNNAENIFQTFLRNHN